MQKNKRPLDVCIYDAVILVMLFIYGLITVLIPIILSGHATSESIGFSIEEIFFIFLFYTIGLFLAFHRKILLSLALLFCSSLPGFIDGYLNTDLESMLFSIFPFLIVLLLFFMTYFFHNSSKKNNRKDNCD